MIGEGDLAMTNYKEPGDPCIPTKSSLVGKAYGLRNSKPRPGILALNKRSQPGKYTKSLAYM